MAGISDIAKTAGIKEEHVKSVTDAITSITKGGESVIIKGFGTFKVKTRAAKAGKNPKTGEPITIPAKDVLTFKPAKPAKK